MNVQNNTIAYFLVVAFAAALVGGPVLGKLLVWPRTEFFSEFWILDDNHQAANYPGNITRNVNYSFYLGISNRLGYCAYYVVQVKFRNQSQPGPTSFGRLGTRPPSNLTALFNMTAFVADLTVDERLITFSIDYEHDATLSRVDFHSITLDGSVLNLEGLSTEWDFERDKFPGHLFFELWIYEPKTSSIKYHERFVSLPLNMTAT